MIPISTLLAGTDFFALAAFNVLLMLEASRPTCSGTVKSRLLKMHRIAGYLFVSLMCIMAVIMSQRLFGVGLSKSPASLVIHIALALVLVPLTRIIREHAFDRRLAGEQAA